MCLHMQVRKLSLLGIAVAGLYCCMGLRSVSIAPRSSLLLRSDPSIVNFNWQGSLVIGLPAIPQNNHCLDRKKPFVPTVSFVSLLPRGDTTIRHELLGFFGFCWNLKGIGSKPDGSTPQIADSDVHSRFVCVCIYTPYYILAYPI